jgi:hypothetical protein
MGNDQLFRKAKTPNSLARRKVGRRPNKRILIVCEGTKTERGYFKPVIQSLELLGVDVVIRDDCGSAPISVVEHAEVVLKAEGPAEAGGYNFVFCVFDRDAHETYEAAKSKVMSLKRKYKGYVESISCVTSIPCIEYWFLLHFFYRRAPYVAAQGKSVGDMCLADLKKNQLFKDYDKKLTAEQIRFLIAKLSDAKAHAKRAIDDYTQTGEENPTTLIHEVFEQLAAIKQGSEQERAKSRL